MEGHLTGNGALYGLYDLPVDRFCAFVWWFCTRHLEDSDRESFKARLWRPDPKSTKPIPKESPWSAENETKGFAALKMGTGA